MARNLWLVWVWTNNPTCRYLSGEIYIFGIETGVTMVERKYWDYRRIFFSSTQFRNVCFHMFFRLGQFCFTFKLKNSSIFPHLRILSTYSLWSDRISQIFYDKVTYQACPLRRTRHSLALLQLRGLVLKAFSDAYEQPPITVLSKMALTAETPLAGAGSCLLVSLPTFSAANSHLRVEKDVLMTLERIENAQIVYTVLFSFSFKVFSVVPGSFVWFVQGDMKPLHSRHETWEKQM